MLPRSHVHQLFSVETCQTSLHPLRWKDRPLPCPRCQSQAVDPWGQYHYRPGGKRSWCNGCKRTFHERTHTLLQQSTRSLPYWLLATCLRLARRATRPTAGSRSGGAGRVAGVSSARRAGATMPKPGARCLRGAVARGRSSSRRPKIARSRRCQRPPPSRCTRAVSCRRTRPAAIGL